MSHSDTQLTDSRKGMGPMYNRLAEIINWYFSPVQGAADAARTGLGVLPARSSAN